MFRFPRGVKSLPTDPIFLTWVNFIKKAPITIFSSYSKYFKSDFFINFRKLKLFQKTSNFFSVSLLSLIFSTCLVLFDKCEFGLQILISGAINLEASL